jgi:hypothetical protein
LQPKDHDLTKISSDVTLSKTLFPTMWKRWNQVSIVRSMRAFELQHFNGQYHTQSGRVLAPAVAKEVPAYGSLVAYELEKQRRETDTFPGYISTALTTSRSGSLSAGFLPPQFAALDLNPTTVFDTLGGTTDEKVSQLLQERWKWLAALSEVSDAERLSLGDKAVDYQTYYRNAHRLLEDPRWTKAFQLTKEDKERYGESQFGLGLVLARNLVASDAGTRFVYVYDSPQDWDAHAKIFDRSKPQNHYMTCNRWDKGFSALVDDLTKLPGREPGKTLLDETIVLSTSEFGRTPEINPIMGRHHWRFNYSSLMIGGGIKPGRIIGKSDEKGAYNVDPGWKHKEQPYNDNLVASIYSALGIDWRKKITNTPSGRDYYYVQTAPVGGNEFISDDEIAELFV